MARQVKARLLYTLRRMSARSTAPNQFLNGSNYQKIVGFLRQHYSQKLGISALPERMDGRLQKSVQHYMTEVAKVQGAHKPLQNLNQAVLKETTTSMDAWLKKQDSSSPPITTTLGAFPKQEEYSRLFEDTTSRYESMMTERAPQEASVQQIPDFRTAQDMSESDEDPVVLMQRIQKQRDEQARGMGLAGVPPRLEIREELAPAVLQVTPPQSDAPPPLLAPRPQDYIIPQEDIQKYRETEYNVFLTSSDRDWLRNNVENRYNFTVNFNTGSKKTGYSYSASLQERFRNIQRIEFVKAIVPIESLTTLCRVTAESPSIVYDTNRVVNVFSLPFAGVRIAELNNNGFSTKPEEDNTFALVQYDTTWSSDLIAPATAGGTIVPALTKSGFTGLIPKFLKTQKVYSPTPLATLQRLSIRLERHSGELLSGDSDVHFFKRIAMSGAFTNTIGSDSTLYSVNSPQNSYIFLQTTKYFPFSAVAEGDNIQIQAYAPVATTSAATDFAAFINRAEGHYVVATAYVNGAGALTDGRNSGGYCNVIILRSRFDDPTTGSVGRTAAYFGGGDGSAENTLATALDNTSSEPDQTKAALLNTSRQTHIVLRVITRDYDSSANIRPDNI